MNRMMKTMAANGMKVEIFYPGRISFSKHADYVNSDLLYALDTRGISIQAELIKDPQHKSFKKLCLVNESGEFTNLEIDVDKINTEKQESWDFYIRKLLQSLLETALLGDERESFENNFLNSGLVININSNLPFASGLSSSHALILASLEIVTRLYSLQTFLAAFNPREADPKPEELLAQFKVIQLCQLIEFARGFKSGLGDQSAQLLAQDGYLSFIKIHPKLEHLHYKIPKQMAWISAPSFVLADKSSKEIQAKNLNLDKYKLLNELVAKLFPSAYEQYEEFVAINNTRGLPLLKNLSLGDLVYLFPDQEILTALLTITDPELQSLALYALGETSRLYNLREQAIDLEDKATPEEEAKFIKYLGWHLNQSHKAEQNYYFTGDRSKLRSLNKEQIAEALEQKNWSEINNTNRKELIPESSISTSRTLSEHCGSYAASTLVNDQLQWLITQVYPKPEHVHGSSISGAGFGGNNIILCDAQHLSEIKQWLQENFYQPRNLDWH